MRRSAEDLFPVPVSCVFCHLLDIRESIGTHFFLILSVCASAIQSYKATTPCFSPSIIYRSLSMHKESCGRPEPIPAVTGRKARCSRETCCVSSFLWMRAFRVLPALPAVQMKRPTPSRWGCLNVFIYFWWLYGNVVKVFTRFWIYSHRARKNPCKLRGRG